MSYQQILNIFWDNHNPTEANVWNQYRSIIFYHNKAQKQAALESLTMIEQKLGIPVFTEIVPFSLFYLSEDFLQKYFLQGVPELFGELREYYPNFYGFVNSTTAARLNSFIAGYGSPEQLHEELESYGLSTEGKQLLLEIVGFKIL